MKASIDNSYRFMPEKIERILREEVKFQRLDENGKQVVVTKNYEEYFQINESRECNPYKRLELKVEVKIYLCASFYGDLTIILFSTI